jgi:3-hydroxybutyryl-CoA dehydrogenase
MRTVGVIGAGTMGSGIAYVTAAAGSDVLLYDVSSERIENGLTTVHSILTRAVEKNVVSPEAVKKIVEHIKPAHRLSDLAPASIVVEAAVEDLPTKKNIFRQLEEMCSEKTILSSNTSSLSITEIASACRLPQRIAGLHFFNPPHVMKLVEVIRGHLTSDEVVSTLVVFARELHKTPVVVADTPGFIVNRVARPFYGEALRLLGEGVSTVEEIDRIVRLEGGFKMGPFELMDLIGIDVNLAVTQSVYQQFFDEPRFRPHPLQQKMVRAGMLGRKTGRGFYDYKQKKP